MMNLGRRTKFATLFLFLCAGVYLGAFFDLWSPLEEYSPIQFADDPIQLILNSTFASSSIDSSGDLNGTDSSIGLFSPQNQSLAYCPISPPNLVGPIAVLKDGPSFEELVKLNPDLEVGGHGQPKDCKARHRVAIIVPYRDRESQLKVFLHNIHGYLKKQQIDYGIFIVEQMPNQTFNRAKLMNIGYVESLKLYDFQCFIFHDVDLLPEDDRNLYTCPEEPRHMSVAIDKFKYQLPYNSIFGGISALTRQHVEKINGFSNDYWGWGGEDDDLSTRVAINGFKIMRYPGNIARYKMITHTKEKSNPVNPCRYTLMKRTRTRFRHDGLSNLNYKVLFSERLPLYTHFVVDLMEKESRDRLHSESRSLKKC